MMTSLGVAAATSSPARVPSTVTNRQLLWQGGVVEVQIPQDASLGAFMEGGANIAFLQFKRTVKGGIVNCFLLGGNLEEYRGRKIHAAVEVRRKDLADGRSFLYLDFHPVARDKPITHRLAVMSGPADTSGRGVVFPTPAPIVGYVIITSPEEKIVPPVKVVTAPVQKPASTGDSQLDRLLAAGWQISQEGTNEKIVHLYKANGGTTKTMVHYRPKKKKNP